VLVYLGASRGIDAARRDARFFRLCGIRRLIGVPETEEMQRNRWREHDQTLEPEAERLIRNLAELGEIDLNTPASWELYLTETEQERAGEVLRPVANCPLIAVSVGTKRQSNDWGPDNWRALLAKLAESYPDHALVLTGAMEESEVSEYAAEGWRGVFHLASRAPRIVNLCGLLTPRESAAALRQARIFIGHDSGPVHLAPAVQTPCVGIFSARNKPGKWFPYGRQHRVIYHRVDCWGCRLETCIVEQKKCITSISVDEVFTQIRAVVDEHNFDPRGHAMPDS
jgi:ADP-heptose:LPS heptosyltransferase